jgi:uncharacterized protein (DUF1778 family)
MSNDVADPETINTFLGIRVPDDLREKIRAAAKLEDRTESSFARFHLSRAADVILMEDDKKPKPAARV